MDINRIADREDFETIFICAVRYCIGRQTYMPRLVQSQIRQLNIVCYAK